MTKEDLKTGMVVETRNEELFLVVRDVCLDDGNIDLLVNESGHNTFDEYDNNLLCECDSRFDIMKVYKSKYGNLIYDISNYKDLILIWDRKEKPQLTERERAYLKAYSYDYEWVARNESDDLFWFKEKPMKGYHYWETDNQRYNSECWYSLGKSFGFIKWGDEEPYRIKDLLGE